VFKDRKGLTNHSRIHCVDDDDDALTLTATPSAKKQKKGVPFITFLIFIYTFSQS
jgi:hypothetical protein